MLWLAHLTPAMQRQLQMVTSPSHTACEPEALQAPNVRATRRPSEDSTGGGDTQLMALTGIIVTPKNMLLSGTTRLAHSWGSTREACPWLRRPSNRTPSIVQRVLSFGGGLLVWINVTRSQSVCLHVSVDFLWSHA